MSTPAANGAEPASDLHELLKQLEARIARIESYLRLQPLESPDEQAVAEETVAARDRRTVANSREDELEHQIGEFWLARIGIVALLTGIAFLITYPFQNLPAIIPIAAGFAAVAGLFWLSRFWQSTYSHLSGILFGGGQVLLFFATLRLHFFNEHPIIANKVIALVLVVAVLAFHFYAAAKRRSEFLAIVAMVLCFATSLISETTLFALSFIAVTCAATVYLLYRFDWQILVNLCVVLAYSTHLLWLLNNPLMGRPIGAVAEHENNIVFLFLYAAIFVAANLFHYQTAATSAARILRTILNGIGLFALSNLVALTYFEPKLALVNLCIAVFFLAAAVFYWLHRQSKYSTSIYACLGYLALSAAIIVYFESPELYIWLGWQSLLVVSTAVWFRSKIVIVANILIYAGILLVYLFASSVSGLVNLNYAAVALLSARVLNWQKTRLALRTEMIRNVYLASAFVIVPFGLYHVVPDALISLSWLGAAVFYFVLSILLKNKKYRWMAIGTIFITAVYVFLIDLARLEPFYRIISFLALGLVLLVVSVLYNRFHSRFSS